MFLNYRGGLAIDDQVIGKTRRYVPLIDKSDFAGRWHRIEVHAKWQRDATGFFRVWVNGRKKLDYSGSTMSAETVYFRYGVYRSFISRYVTQFGATQVPAQTAYFANVERRSSEPGQAK